MLTRNQVVRAGLAVVDSSGFTSLSAREIATQLGVSPMAIYRHVSSMEDLRGEVAERALLDVDLPPPAGRWQGRVHRIVTELLRVCRRYRGLPLGEARGPARTGIESALGEALREAGCAKAEIARRVHLVLAAVTGHVALTTVDVTGHADRDFERALDDVVGALARGRDRHTPGGDEVPAPSRRA